MNGGLLSSSSRLAIVAGGLFVGGAVLTPAQAADLGGDCCADLEERVAELEATAVRHANRRVSLQLAGQVNSAVMWYDNGEESDVYVIDNDESSSRLRLRGNGTVQPGLTIGFQIEVDFLGNGTAENDQDDLAGFNVRRAEWNVASDNLGTLTVGQGSMSSDGSFEVSFSDAWYGSVGYGLAVTNNFSFLVFNDNTQSYTGVTWGDIGTDNDASRRNRIRYDSPTFAGFSVSAAWGEDDEWDTTLRYANEFNGIRIAAAASYREDNDDNDGRGRQAIDVVGLFPGDGQVGGVQLGLLGDDTDCVNGDAGTNDDGDVNSSLNGNDCTELNIYGGSVAVMHVPSGLHLQGGYSVQESNAVNSFTFDGSVADVEADDPAIVGGVFADEAAIINAEDDRTIANVATPDFEHWWGAVGIQFRASSLGSSDITAQYIRNDAGLYATGADNDGDDQIDTVAFDQIEYTSYGIGFTQNIDAIGAAAYISYNRHEAEADGAADDGSLDLDSEFDQVTAGMRVTF